jgi:alginate O-acetyltransferase complex protein AlgI
MLFNSSIFLFAFLPVTLGAAAVIGGHRHINLVQFVVLASLSFYGWWKPQFLILAVLTIGINFWLGRIIYQTRSKVWLAAGVGLNLCPLAFFKYYNFAAEGLHLLGSGWPPFLDLFLPLAISFLTFEQISYLVDCKKRTTTPTSFWDYAFFVSFFPKLIAGPIVRYNELQPQIRNLAVSFSTIAPGLTLFIIGLGKKVILADSAAPYSDSIFLLAAQGHSIGFSDAWLATLAYTVQIYFDFSGYSDMALGLGLMFGIRLPVNFDSPYKSQSIIEFWRCWHITLSRFLRDYIYIPLGGGRVGKLRQYLNLMVVMLIGGLWHGAGVNFVIWGGLHGVYLIINHLGNSIAGNYRPSNKAASKVPAAAGRLVTFLAVCVAWVFFRAPTLSSAATILTGMFGYANGGAQVATILQADALVIVSALLAITWFCPNSMELMGLKQTASASSTHQIPELKWTPSLGWSAFAGAIGAVAMVSLSKPAPFIYFQF